MREIRFRGRDDKTGEWRYGWLIGNTDTYIISSFRTVNNKQGIKEFLNSCSDMYRVDPKTVGQDTGLKDKNGKEIYEGDIVKGFYPDLGQVKFGEHETSTDYYASSAYGWFIETPNQETYQIKIQNNTEIIGNIYENPSLLTNK